MEIIAAFHCIKRSGVLNVRTRSGAYYRAEALVAAAKVDKRNYIITESVGLVTFAAEVPYKFISVKSAVRGQSFKSRSAENGVDIKSVKSQRTSERRIGKRIVAYFLNIAVNSRPAVAIAA